MYERHTDDGVDVPFCFSRIRELRFLLYPAGFPL